MNLPYHSLFIIVTASLLASCNAAEGQAEPPCPIEGFDECILEKGTAFSLAVGGREQQDFFYRSYQKACDDLDADGCFALGSLLDEADAIVQALPPHYLLPERTDKTAAIKALEKSCSLGSAMGCATLSETLINNLPTEFQSANIQDKVPVFAAQMSACELGWLEACDVYLELSRHVEPEDWPDGALVFSETEKTVAAKLCENDNLDGCYSEAIADFLIADAMGGSELQFDKGMALLERTCNAGHEDSCMLHSDLLGDQED